MKSTLRKKFVVVCMALLVCCLASLLAAGCFGGNKNDAANNATAGKEAAQHQGKQAAHAKTANGNEANAIVRSEDERKAQSSSTNEELPGRHVVYLTFDDGPSTNTHRILETLDKYGVKATWFIKGDQDKVEYCKDIWEAGNQLAIHTYSHRYEQVYASVDSYFSDLDRAGAMIKEQVGFVPTLVRFPGGSVNSYNGSMSDDLISGLHSRGYHYFDWNVSSGDGGDHPADEIAGYVMSGAEGCNSACVLMHDSAAKDSTVEALPRIIEYFIDNGFEFDVLTSDSFGYHF